MRFSERITKMNITKIPEDQRVPVVIHEILPDNQSFMTPSGHISFIRDRPDELAAIDAIDEKIRENYDQIFEAPPALHVHAGHVVLAFYEDSFYRGFCLRAPPRTNEAEIWFSDYGNISQVSKTNLRTISKEWKLDAPAVSMLGKLKTSSNQTNEIESWIVEDFNKKLLAEEGRKAGIISSGATRYPFKIYTVDIVVGDSDSSFLTLISNKSKLDWGFSHESPPIRIDPRLSVSPNYKTQSAVGRRTSAHGQGLPDMSSLRISPAKPLGASPKCPTDSGSPVTPVRIPRYR